MAIIEAAKKSFELEHVDGKTLLHFEPTSKRQTLKGGLSSFFGWPSAIFGATMIIGGFGAKDLLGLLIGLLSLALGIIAIRFGMREKQTANRRGSDFNTLELHEDSLVTPMIYTTGKAARRQLDKSDIGTIFACSPDGSFQYKTGGLTGSNYQLKKSQAERRVRNENSVTCDYGADRVSIIDGGLTWQQAEAIRDVIVEWSENSSSFRTKEAV